MNVKLNKSTRLKCFHAWEFATSRNAYVFVCNYGTEAKPKIGWYCTHPMSKPEMGFDIMLISPKGSIVYYDKRYKP